MDDDKLDLILKKLDELENRVEKLESKTQKEVEKDLSKVSTVENIVKKEEKEISTEEKELKVPFLFRNNKMLRLNNALLILIAVVVVAVLVLIIIHFSSTTIVTSQSSTNSSLQFFSGPIGEPMNASFISQLSDLSQQLQTVGNEELNGTIKSYNASSSSNNLVSGYSVLIFSNGDYDVVPLTITNHSLAPLLTQNGKPTFVYIGAQGCPYCAIMRYVFAITLSRFGNFSELFYDRSATIDGNIPTFSFNFSNSLFNQDVVNKQPIIQNGKAVAPYGDEFPTGFFSGAYYNSNYVNFLAFDQVGSSFLVNESGLGLISPLIYNDVIVPSQYGVVEGSSGYPTSADGFGIKNFWLGGVPFFDINNQYVFDGAIIYPALTASDYVSQQDMLDSIKNTSSLFGQSVLGAVNILTAEICTTLNNTAPVCSLSYISSLEKKLGY